jgi:cell division protein ZapA
MADADTTRESGATLNTIKVMGHEYRIRSDSDPEHLQEVAHYLDRVLREVSDSTKDTQDAAVLAALNVASELLELRRLEAVPRERIQALIDLVDSA